MSVLDLALRFNSRPSNEVSDGDETVPAGTNLGQHLIGDKPLNERRKQAASRAWDTWDNPYTVPDGTATTDTLGTAETVGTLGTVGNLGRPPDDWVDRIGDLISRPYPDGLAPQRWALLCNGVEYFAKQWAAKAVLLGWSFNELFALAEPFANLSLQGAAWFTGESTVTAVTADAITLRTEGGAIQRIYRKSRVEWPTP
jgi:hypothetical protein